MDFTSLAKTSSWNDVLDLDFFRAGKEAHDLLVKLFPILRSLAGPGVRQTHRIISEYIQLKISEIESGKSVLDWDVPREWILREAVLKGPDGQIIVDAKNNNLHVVSHSVPIKQKMTLDELQSHLYSIPEKPNTLPYVTSYYKENWGFCLAHAVREKLQPGTYEVIIDSELKKGSMTISELYLPGKIKDEILLTCYTCHPSMANDNLSGVVCTTYLGQILQKIDRYYSYRLLFIPETIGAIAWLAANEKSVPLIRAGLVLMCLGGGNKLGYKKSRRGDTWTDEIVQYALAHCGEDFVLENFHPLGSDERQFCSPGFNLPVGSLRRGFANNERFTQYHTSDDTPEFVTADSLGQSLSALCSILYLFEHDRSYLSTCQKGEPMFSKRNLYRTTGAQRMHADEELAIFWLMNESDGSRSLLKTALRSGLNFSVIVNAARRLEECGLLVPSES